MIIKILLLIASLFLMIYLLDKFFVVPWTTASKNIEDRKLKQEIHK